MLLDPVEYVDPPNACTPVPMPAPVSYREGIGEISTYAWHTDGSIWDNQPTWTTVATQPNADTISMETGTNHSSQWLNLEKFGW